jgi:hypothetical protein
MSVFKKRNSQKPVGWLMAIVPGLFLSIALLAPLTASAKITIIKPTPPATPGDFHAAAVTETSISFAWSPSKAGTYPIKYYVINELSPSDGFSMTIGGSATSFNWTFVEESTTYTFEIYAVDSDYNVSAPSAPITVSTPPTPIVPAPPVITGTSSTPTNITVNWTEATPSSDLQGFIIQVSPGAGSVEFNSQNPAEATSATIGGLFAGTSYSIDVVAASVTFNNSTSQVVTATTTVSPNNIPPTAPTDLTVTTDPGTGLPDLSWNGSTSPYEPSSNIEYVIIEDGVPDFDDSPAAGQTSAQDIFDRVGAVPMNVSVVAVDQFGNVSPPSNTVSVTTFN